MRALALRTLLVALALPGLALAQGLGDAAAREKQKRQAAPKGKATRVITNDDLRKDEPDKDKKAEGQGASPALDSGSSASSSSYQAERESGSNTASETDARQQAIDQAQAQIDSARSAVVAAEARVKELGDKLNPMSPSYVYGQPNAADATAEEIRTRQALQAAEAELAGARDALVQANKGFEDVRQGRRPLSNR
jgi:chromosome segregation ATPase